MNEMKVLLLLLLLLFILMTMMTIDRGVLLKSGGCLDRSTHSRFAFFF